MYFFHNEEAYKNEDNLVNYKLSTKIVDNLNIYPQN